jgi:hypothetical protein
MIVLPHITLVAVPNALRATHTTALALRIVFPCRCIISLSASQDEAFSRGISSANDISSSKFAAVDGTAGQNGFVRRPRSFSRWNAFVMGAIHCRDNIKTDVCSRNFRQYAG